MFDEVDQIVAAQEVVQEAPVQQEQKRESDKENNMRVMRERAEAAERRALELERMIQANMAQQQPTKISVQEEEDDFYVGDEESYVQGKELKRNLKSLKQENRATRKQLEETNQRYAIALAEMKLKGQFNDFESVVSKENLDKLAMQKPSLYRSIMANQDIYDRGYTAYEMIKGSGIMSESYANIDRKIEENRSKPRAAANVSPQVGDTPLARVGDYDRRILTEDQKERYRQQVEAAKMHR